MPQASGKDTPRVLSWPTQKEGAGVQKDLGSGSQLCLACTTSLGLSYLSVQWGSCPDHIGSKELVEPILIKGS